MLVAPNLVCNLFSKSIIVKNKLRTIFCVYTDLCNSSAWLVDLCGVGGYRPRTRNVKDIINSENCYVIYFWCIIDIKSYFFIY